MAKEPKTIYRILFSSQGKSYELYARQLGQPELYGFVEISDLVFGEKSALVVDPGEESLRNEFGKVRRLLIPYHAVARIDEVERAGPGKVIALSGSGESNGAGSSPVMPPQPPRKG